MKGWGGSSYRTMLDESSTVGEVEEVLEEGYKNLSPNWTKPKPSPIPLGMMTFQSKFILYIPTNVQRTQLIVVAMLNGKGMVELDLVLRTCRMVTNGEPNIPKQMTTAIVPIVAA